MSSNMQTEIPQAMRELTANTIDHARVAYNQLLDSSRQAQEMMTGMISSNLPSSPALQGLNEAQERTMRLIRKHVDAGFALANELTKATDLAEFLQIQGRHAQLQMQAYALQAQEFAGPANRTTQKVKLGS